MSDCRSKNYCSTKCWWADVDYHKVCCYSRLVEGGPLLLPQLNPDQDSLPDNGLCQIEERKVKIGGKEKFVAANAALDSLAEEVSLKFGARDPDLAKKYKEVANKTKEKPGAKVEKKKYSPIDEVD